MKTQVNRLGFLFWFKWLLSFVWPIKVISTENDAHYLELILFQGNRLLNSRNANLSNGNLQVAYKNVFHEEVLNIEDKNSALVLGFGLGGVSVLLNKRNPRLNQIGVEVSKTVLEWYERYCPITPGVELICADALSFIENQTRMYDLIIVDVYNDLDVPLVFQEKEILRKLALMLNEGGVLIFNKVVANSKHKEELNQLILDLSKFYKSVKVNIQFDLNRFIICQNKT